MSDKSRTSIADWEVEDAWIVRPFVIEVWFKDGEHRTIDVRDPDYFLRGAFDREAGTITWPNGADYAPEFLRYGPRQPRD